MARDGMGREGGRKRRGWDEELGWKPFSSAGTDHTHAAPGVSTRLSDHDRRGKQVADTRLHRATQCTISRRNYRCAGDTRFRPPPDLLSVQNPFSSCGEPALAAPFFLLFFMPRSVPSLSLGTGLVLLRAKPLVVGRSGRLVLSCHTAAADSDLSAATAANERQRNAKASARTSPCLTLPASPASPCVPSPCLTLPHPTSPSSSLALALTLSARHATKGPSCGKAPRPSRMPCVLAYPPPPLLCPNGMRPRRWKIKLPPLPCLAWAQAAF